jgi:acyl-CoA hydrolase
MSKFKAEYNSKLITRDQAAGMVKSGDTVDFYGYSSAGRALDSALAKRVGDLKNVTIRTIIAFHPYYETMKADPGGISFHYETWFHDAMTRRDPHPNNIASIACTLYEIPSIYRHGHVKNDVCSFRVAPMDEDGYFSFGMSSVSQKAAVDSAKCFVAEIDHGLFNPKNVHPESRVHISEIDYIIDEGKSYDFVFFPDPVPGEIDKKIAHYVAGELVDGNCFQIGVGNVSQAVIQIISEMGLKDLGVHTEMFTDGLMDLYKKGNINCRRKNIDKGKMVTTFAAGSQAIYDFVRECDDLIIAPVDYTNNINVIGQIDNFMSIQACMEIDLQGQMNSESIGPRSISGTGGQLDFVFGAYRSKGGKSIICCPSTYKKKDGSIGSKIQPILPPGATITTPKSAVNYVCTEYGIVNLKGQNSWGKAEMLISIAHPDFREDLIKEAEKMGLWRKSNEQ